MKPLLYRAELRRHREAGHDTRRPLPVQAFAAYTAGMRHPAAALAALLFLWPAAAAPEAHPREERARLRQALREAPPAERARRAEALGRFCLAHGYPCEAAFWLRQKAAVDADAFLKEAAKGCALRQARAHPLWYAASLPERWDARKRWPLLIDIAGNDGDAEAAVRAWAPHRARGYVVACPVTLSNLNEQGGAFLSRKPLPYDEKVLKPLLGDHPAQEAWESDGLEAMVEELVRDAAVDPDRVVLTGVSGGGNLAYFTIFRRRASFRAVAPRNPNFYARNLDLGPLPKDPPPVPFPVHVFEAADDEYAAAIGPGGPPGVRPQTSQALAQLKFRGFTDVRHTLVPGATHATSSRYFGQVLDWFDGVLKKSPNP